MKRHTISDRPPIFTVLYIGLLACILAAPRTEAADLKPETAQAFDDYVRLAELRMQDETPATAFLWAARRPEPQRHDAFARLQRGDVITDRVIDPDHERARAHLPGALIHHWIGTVFIPGASLQTVLAVLQDYNQHKNYYAPQVIESATVSRSNNSFQVYYRLVRTKVITVVLDTNYDVQYEQLDAMRAASRSYSTRIAEVESAGKRGERRLPPGHDHGFLWRLDSFWRFQQADNGVYVQCEAISLTRDIPTGMNWLVAPFAESVPKESLEFTLQATRTAVLNHLPHVSAQSK